MRSSPTQKPRLAASDRACSTVVGRYTLFEAIASGGMASVHLGRLIGPVGFARTVAIKRLHEQFASDPEFVAMFLDEARLAARVRHPNVVPTLDVVAADGELLLVMEYVCGASLSQLLKQAQRAHEAAPIPILVDVMISVLNGLHAAHEATSERGEPLQIVHRDVSPQNILVGTDGVARVLDFGVAKAVGQTHQTQTGQLKGKLRYMAPEQIRGQRIDRRADIYAAGVVLWEALTGNRLVSGNNDGQILYQVLEGSPPPPSQLRSLSRELDAIVLRALRKDPGERFDTARAMAIALEAASMPVTRSAVAAWVVERAGDDISQRQARVAAVESNSAASTPERADDSRASVSEVRAGTPATQSNALIQVAPARVSLAPARRRFAQVSAAVLACLALGTWALLRRTPPRVEAAALPPPPAAPARDSAAPPGEPTPRALPVASVAAAQTAPLASAARAPGPSAGPARTPRNAAAQRPTKTVTSTTAQKGAVPDRMYRRD